MFGEEFAAQVVELSLDEWTGPRYGTPTGLSKHVAALKGCIWVGGGIVHLDVLGYGRSDRVQHPRAVQLAQAEPRQRLVKAVLRVFGVYSVLG